MTGETPLPEDPIADLSLTGEPLADTAEPHGHDPDDGDDPDAGPPGVLDGVADALRGLFGRNDRFR